MTIDNFKMNTKRPYQLEKQGQRTRGAAPFFFALLILLVAGCTNLSGEPDIIGTIPPPAREDLRFPVLGVGASIFGANCTQCHGTNGAGDGTLVESGQVMNPGNFNLPEQMSAQTPRDYFNIITNGNIENLMPPWNNALNDAERWSVALYTYTLHYTPEQVASGEALYIDEIEERINTTFGDPEDPNIMVDVADDEIRAVLAEAELLPDAQMDVVAYVRSLSIDAPDIRSLAVQIETTTNDTTTTGQDNQQPLVEEDTLTGVISGTVTNGTEGGSVPAELTLTLRIFDEQMDEPQTLTTQTNPDGIYRFDDVPVLENTVYLVSTTYQDSNFGERLDPSTFEDGVAELPIFIYEVTNDPEVIQISEISTQISSRSNVNVLDLVQTYVINNTSDRVFLSDDTLPDGRSYSLELPLPPAAIVFDNGTERFFYDDATFTYYDTIGVAPGEGYQVQVVYLLPYEQSAVIEFPVNYAMDDGIISFLIASDALNFVSEEYVRFPEEMQREDSDLFGNVVQLVPGDLIRYEINGSLPSVGTSTDSSVVTADSIVPLMLLGSVVLLLIITGAFFLLRNLAQRTNKSRDGDIDAVINALLSQLEMLDSQHEAGEINHDVYQRRRAEIQKHLAVMRDEPLPNTEQAQTT